MTTTSDAVGLPDPEIVGRRAAAILGAVHTESDDNGARRRAAYRRARDVLANATSAHLVDLLDVDDELKRTAARDELLRRGEPVGR